MEQDAAEKARQDEEKFQIMEGKREVFREQQEEEKRRLTKNINAKFARSDRLKQDRGEIVQRLTEIKAEHALKRHILREVVGEYGRNQNELNYEKVKKTA